MLLTSLYALFAAMHLWAAGVASVGPLLAAGLRWLGRDEIDSALKRLGWWSIGTLVATALLGLAMGVGLWSAPGGEYAAMLGRFPRQLYLYTAIEGAFTLVCYGVWLATWDRWRKRPGLHAVLPIVGATNLLYHVPPLMFVQRMLVEEPRLVAEEVVTRALFLPLMFSHEVMAKTLHFWGAAGVATAALGLGLLVSKESNDTKSNDTKPSAVRRVALLGLVAVLWQLVTGMAVLLAAPDLAQTMLGRSPLATAALMIAVVVAIGLLGGWLALVLTPSERRPVRWIFAGVATLFFAMSLAVRV